MSVDQLCFATLRISLFLFGRLKKSELRRFQLLPEKIPRSFLSNADFGARRWIGLVPVFIATRIEHRSREVGMPSLRTVVRGGSRYLRRFSVLMPKASLSDCP